MTSRTNKKSSVSRRMFLKAGSAAAVGTIISPTLSVNSAHANFPTAIQTGGKDLKNVIVIMLDSLHWGYVGTYGSKWCITPELDRFASEATVFDNAYAEGMPTVPCRTALLTGNFTLPVRGWEPLRSTDQLLQEVLWNQGYTSAFICDTFHMHKPGMGFSQGWDYVQWIRGQEDDPVVVNPDVKVDITPYYKPRTGTEQEKHQLIQYLKNRTWWKGDEDHYIAQVVKASLKWLTGQRRRDCIFFWMDAFDPHEPWDPSPPYDKMYNPGWKGLELILPIPGEVEGYLTPEELHHVKALYAGEVTLVDKWVGIFLEELKNMGFYDNSLIMIITDHGEPLGEHGIVRKSHPWPYEELAKLVWMVRIPDGTGHGKRIKPYIHSTDLFPSVLDYLNIKPSRYVQGKSFLPLIRGEKEKLWDFAIAGYYNQSWSIRQDNWSYYYYLPQRSSSRQRTSRLVRTKPELYNLKNDPMEQTNLANTNKEIAEKLDTTLKTFVDRMAKTQPSENPRRG